jgi:hypothetical protein
MADVYITVSGAGTETGVDWANAYSVTDLQTAFDDLTAGDTLWMEEGTYTIPAIIDLNATSGTGANIISVIGVNSLHVDDGTIIAFDANASYANCISANASFWFFKNLEFINATGDGFKRSSGGNWYFFNCSASNNSADGWEFTNGNSCWLVSCLAYSNTIYGIDGTGSDYTHVDKCLIKLNAGGLNLKSGSISNSIIHDNTNVGIFSMNTHVTACVVDENGIGINGVFSGGGVINNCRITHNTTGINASSAYMCEKGNFYYNNTTKFDHSTGTIISLGDSVDGSSDGYIDRANDDFKLTDGGEGTGVAIPIGSVNEVDNIGYFDFGIPPQSDSGGGRQTRFQIRGA